MNSNLIPRRTSKKMRWKTARVRKRAASMSRRMTISSSNKRSRGMMMTNMRKRKSTVKKMRLKIKRLNKTQSITKFEKFQTRNTFVIPFFYICKTLNYYT